MRVLEIPVGPFESNCFFVSTAGGCLVIDPGDDAERLISLLREEKLTPSLYLLTHGHMDHVFALADLVKAFPAPVGMHPVDAGWAFTDVNIMPPYYETAPVAPASIARNLADGQVWEDIGLKYRIIETPGHSPGSVSFYFPEQNLCFCGDTLFSGSVGRTDLPGGDARVLKESLKRLAALPGNTVIFPGHGPKTSILQEKKTNFYLRGMS